jgi:ATPase subunit of ABC transporter with duplicated ATPase domains
MQVTLNKVGKRFNLEWIFRNIDYSFHQKERYAITGSNGSGKSTLLQIIAGAIMLNEGSVNIKTNAGFQTSNSENFFKSISFVAPYLELIDEMTAQEMLRFHNTFKRLSVDIRLILDEVGLAHAANKQIRYYSSGMKQRLKLATAFFNDSPLLLLDEPCTNLDSVGIDLYYQLIEKYTAEKIVIVSSNDQKEYAFCQHILHIEDYKSGLSLASY